MNDKPVFEIVRDKRLLKSLSKKGHFTFPAQFGGNSNQIDERVNEVNKPMRFKQYRDSFGMEIEYEIRYSDGSFYPFLFMRVPMYKNVSGYRLSY
jgi:hypothetical protein